MRMVAGTLEGLAAAQAAPPWAQTPPPVSDVALWTAETVLQLAGCSSRGEGDRVPVHHLVSEMVHAETSVMYGALSHAG